MEKAYNALFELSEDGNSCVLQAAAKCICYVLNELWEIISDEKRMSLLETLMNKFLKEKYYDNVRNEVVLGLCDLAKNKRINKIFLQIFKRIKYLLNDKSLRVRKNFVILVLELNKNLNQDFFEQLDHNEFTKRITKDFFTFSVQSCIKKLSYMKQQYHEKIKNKEICEFLKLSTNLMTYSIWKCDIKEQAKKCINLISEYPVLMICISKFSTNLKIIDRYKLSSVLFEITNIKLRDEDNSILLSENSWEEGKAHTLVNGTKDKGIRKGNGKDKGEDKAREKGKDQSTDKDRNKNKNENKDKETNNALLTDSNLNKNYIRYSSLLVCIANFLKPKNEEEIDFCGTEEIQEFLKVKFAEKYFLDSINTLMQPYYFKLLKYINLNHDNYIVIHKYARKQLNSLHTLTNEHVCEKYIIPLFYKWGLLNSLVHKHMHFLNVSVRFISTHTFGGSIENNSNNSNDKTENSIRKNAFSLKIDDTDALVDVSSFLSSSSVYDTEDDIQHTEQINEKEKYSDGNKGNKGNNKKVYNNDEPHGSGNGKGNRGSNSKMASSANDGIDYTKNDIIDRSKKIKDMYLNNEKELNALIFLSLIVKKKKYHYLIFKSYADITYNFIYKFNSFLLHVFQRLSLNDFTLPSYFMSTYYEKNKDSNYIQLILCDEVRIKGYMQLYISFFFLFNSFAIQNNYSYEWDTLIENTLQSIHLITSIKFKNEIQIITRNIQPTRSNNNNDEQVQEQRKECASYIRNIIHFILYFLDMIEYTVAMKKLFIEDIDFNDFVKNLFLFCKCYEIANENVKEIKMGQVEEKEKNEKAPVELYFKIWQRISSFLLFILNFDYFEKKTEIKLMIINTFFLFTYENVPKKKIETVVKKYSTIIKEKELFYNFLKNFKNNNDAINYMYESQIKHIQDVLDGALLHKGAAKK
ncbi:conserved Plasmodium protein, unknown function [Plasmodium malariae]|uniref:Condensin-2 complex subunit G2 n=1 Tax=Plasmodium malariae TaxID=5858 RepID=A0A1A8X171_PLAMA|nr:conserved Plasmodium protein, unknown function [Plasmodium malariae]